MITAAGVLAAGGSKYTVVPHRDRRSKPPRSATGPQLKAKVLVQVHCHQGAVLSYDRELNWSTRWASTSRFLTPGCCGIAGSFGYEAGERYRVSLADGFSCREQTVLACLPFATLDLVV
jgi:hypothetical protein